MRFKCGIRDLHREFGSPKKGDHSVLLQRGGLGQACQGDKGLIRCSVGYRRGSTAVLSGGCDVLRSLLLKVQPLAVEKGGHTCPSLEAERGRQEALPPPAEQQTKDHTPAIFSSSQEARRCFKYFNK